MAGGYGQHYESMYSGSMVGSGAVVYALMGYVIAKTDSRTCCVELNEKLLAVIIGESEKTIVEGIKFLCQPDPRSRSKEEQGRRLIRRGEFEYFVVNYHHYRDLLRKVRQNEQAAERMRKLRERNESEQMRNPHVDVDAAASEGSAEGRTENPKMVAAALSAFNLDPMSPMSLKVVQTLRAHCAELCAAGVTLDRLEVVIRWMKSSKSKFMPQSPRTLTDPEKFSQWEQAVKQQSQTVRPF